MESLDSKHTNYSEQFEKGSGIHAKYKKYQTVIVLVILPLMRNQLWEERILLEEMLNVMSP